jgi:hypothetical protein
VLYFIKISRDRIIATDPGFTLFILGLRATTAVGLSLAILVAAARAWHVPPSISLVGPAISFPWAIAPNDAKAGQQRLSSLLLWFPAAASGILGILTAPNRILSDVCIIALLFIAVYLRRWGPRMYATGTIVVLSFYMALFSHTMSAQIIWFLFALLVADLSVFVARFVIISDRADRTFRFAFAAFHARQCLISELVTQAARRGGWNALLRRNLEHHTLKLNETALVMDDILQDADITNARAQLLKNETETLRMILELRRSPQENTKFPELDLDVPKLRAPRWVPRTNFQAGVEVQTRIRPTTRQALQLSCGAASAIFIGELLSPARWYWAMLGTFVVFLRTNSLGETLRRAWSRTLGTAAGAVAGVMIAPPLAGHRATILALLFLFVFGAAYSTRRLYVLMSFFVTGALSMNYLLLNLFTNQILLLRITETLIGAFFGAAAAFFILPIPHKLITNSIVSEAVKRLCDSFTSVSPLDAVRAFDESLQTARVRLVPKRQLFLLTICGYHAKSLALLSIDHDRPPVTIENRSMLIARIEKIVIRLQRSLCA